MVVLGMTSFGNKIYMDWQTDDAGVRSPKFPIFANLIETYQAMVVFEILMLRQNAERFPREQGKWISIGKSFYERQLITSSNQIDDIEFALGIKNAFQRLRYAQVYIRPELLTDRGNS